MVKSFGYVLAAVFALASVYLGVKAQDFKRLQEAMVASELRVATVEAEVKVLREKNDRLEAELEEARAKRDAASAAAVPVEAEVKTEEGTAETTEKVKSPFAAMLEGMQGDSIAEAGAQMNVNMMYSGLFDELGLDAETEAAVRDILMQHMTRATKESLGILSGDTKPQDLKALSKEWDKELHANLAKVLTADEMAVYDAYQEELPVRMLEQQYDMQLSMFAPGLSEETHDLVKEVLVEEMVDLQPEIDGVPDADALQHLSETMDLAFERALERLDPSLSDEDYTAVQGFMDQQRQFMSMAGDMMGPLFEGLAATEAPKEE